MAENLNQGYELPRESAPLTREELLELDKGTLLGFVEQSHRSQGIRTYWEIEEPESSQGESQMLLHRPVTDTTRLREVLIKAYKVAGDLPRYPRVAASLEELYEKILTGYQPDPDNRDASLSLQHWTSIDYDRLVAQDVRLTESRFSEIERVQAAKDLVGWWKSLGERVLGETAKQIKDAPESGDPQAEAEAEERNVAFIRGLMEAHIDRTLKHLQVTPEQAGWEAEKEQVVDEPSDPVELGSQISFSSSIAPTVKPSAGLGGKQRLEDAGELGIEAPATTSQGEAVDTRTKEEVDRINNAQIGPDIFRKKGSFADEIRLGVENGAELARKEPGAFVGSVVEGAKNFGRRTAEGASKSWGVVKDVFEKLNMPRKEKGELFDMERALGPENILAIRRELEDIYRTYYEPTSWEGWDKHLRKAYEKGLDQALETDYLQALRDSFAMKEAGLLEGLVDMGQFKTGDGVGRLSEVLDWKTADTGDVLPGDMKVDPARMLVRKQLSLLKDTKSQEETLQVTAKARAERISDIKRGQDEARRNLELIKAALAPSEDMMLNPARLEEAYNSLVENGLLDEADFHQIVDFMRVTGEDLKNGNATFGQRFDELTHIYLFEGERDVQRVKELLRRNPELLLKRHLDTNSNLDKGVYLALMDSLWESQLQAAGIQDKQSETEDVYEQLSAELATLEKKSPEHSIAGTYIESPKIIEWNGHLRELRARLAHRQMAFDAVDAQIVSGDKEALAKLKGMVPKDLAELEKDWKWEGQKGYTDRRAVVGRSFMMLFHNDLVRKHDYLRELHNYRDWAAKLELKSEAGDRLQALKLSADRLQAIDRDRAEWAGSAKKYWAAQLRELFEYAGIAEDQKASLANWLANIDSAPRGSQQSPEAGPEIGWKAADEFIARHQQLSSEITASIDDIEREDLRARAQLARDTLEAISAFQYARSQDSVFPAEGRDADATKMEDFVNKAREAVRKLQDGSGAVISNPLVWSALAITLWTSGSLSAGLEASYQGLHAASAVDAARPGIALRVNRDTLERIEVVEPSSRGTAVSITELGEPGQKYRNNLERLERLDDDSVGTEAILNENGQLLDQMRQLAGDDLGAQMQIEDQRALNETRLKLLKIYREGEQGDAA